LDLELADKVAVVTGASKGIGLAVTRALVAEGARVVAGARTVEGLAGIERVTPVAVDLASREGPALLVQRAIDEHGRVDGPVSTDLWLGKDGVAQTVAKATGVDAETAKRNVIASIGGLATGRFTTPEEVATLVVMLASKRTANVTGANYVIHGGLIKTT
jgi:NAD(P)-dependent dehydrogenase (short-subunit alcohol dehydrogenase family)